MQIHDVGDDDDDDKVIYIEGMRGRVNVFSAFNPSKCTHTWSSGQADTAAPGEQLGVRCLAQGSHLSREQFLPEPRFEPTTSGYKFDALSIRSQLV